MTRDRCASLSAAVVVLLHFPLGALAQELRVGTEFQVNTFTDNQQRFPSVATETNGDFVVVWESYFQDGSGVGIFGARFSSAGARLATEFQINTFTTDYQKSPAVAADADGDFIVAWVGGGEDNFGTGIFARRFSSTGTPQASEFQVNTLTGSFDFQPSLAADADDDFVVAWLSVNQDYGGGGIFAQRFSSAGTALATEFQVNSYTPTSQTYPWVAADLDGDFVVAWQDLYQDSSDTGIFARRFSSAGVPLSVEFQVNTYTTNAQSHAAVAVSPAGDFVVAWESTNQDGPGRSVFAQRFSSAGTPAGLEFKIDFGFDPAIGIDSDGDFLITWGKTPQNQVFGRRFSSTGAPLSTEFLVSTYVTGNQSNPSVGLQAGDRFVIAWQDNPRDGSNYGVFAQRFKGPSALDVDGNGFLEPLTDGLLVLRKLFGFTGTVLTGNAVGAGCTRCDAAAIEPYINGLGLVLDIDGNTTLGPLTDGLLIVRFLFGFTGTTLTVGAVGGGCSRCDASTIEPYEQGL